jgi:hypothetical protein
MSGERRATLVTEPACLHAVGCGVSNWESLDVSRSIGISLAVGAF